MNGLPNVTNKQLEIEVAAATGSTVTQVKRILKEAGRLINHHLKLNHSVSLFKLGKLYPIKRAARSARNPTTGVRIEVPAKKTLAFRPAASLRDMDV